jgi:hypothetical protein
MADSRDLMIASMWVPDEVYAEEEIIQRTGVVTLADGTVVPAAELYQRAMQNATQSQTSQQAQQNAYAQQGTRNLQGGFQSPVLTPTLDQYMEAWEKERESLLQGGRHRRGGSTLPTAARDAYSLMRAQHNEANRLARLNAIMEHDRKLHWQFDDDDRWESERLA